mmetsp:Transcript_9740/g.24020  ORF Transcript_9740/g.24020 Transcript_9740/m.24020 type:complete len:345 (+) Transcript_9740:1240-2274(+)
MLVPANTRPVRPMRCFTLAWLTHVVDKQLMCLRESYTSCRRSPKSITNRMLGIVSEDSAMLLAKITWQLFASGGENTAHSCSSFGINECSTKMRYRIWLLFFPPPPAPPIPICSSGSSWSCSSVISPMPGRKTKIPSPPFADCMITSFTTSSKSFVMVACGMRPRAPRGCCGFVRSWLWCCACAACASFSSSVSLLCAFKYFSSAVCCSLATLPLCPAAAAPATPSPPRKSLKSQIPLRIASVDSGENSYLLCNSSKCTSSTSNLFAPTWIGFTRFRPSQKYFPNRSPCNVADMITRRKLADCICSFTTRFTRSASMSRSCTSSNTMCEYSFSRSGLFTTTCSR